MGLNPTLGAMRIAIYARFSSALQSEASIDDQVRRCREHIERTGGEPSQATVYSDYAISGASLDRPGFEALMSAVEDRQVDVIITEDISRISRDFADSASVFKRLRYAKVPLISVADGIDTSNRDAKLSFTLKSLVADIYLDDLRDKTLRGLEGRAHAGYATGGLPYGFRSLPESDAGGRVRGHRVEIDDAQTAIVQRIFAMYRDGRSLAAIARTLNMEGIASPRAGTRHKRGGWGASTIRAMLYNERYIGVWKFKETEWGKVPGTNKRRPRARDESEILRFERPHLRVVDAKLWTEVQARLTATRRKYTRDAHGQPKGRARPARKSPYLFSSLLYCGTCEAPMTIVGGSSAAYYRCSDERKKGTCKNRLTVREDVARAGVLAHLRGMLTDRATLADVRQRVAHQLGARARGHHAEITERRERLARTEARIQGLIEFIADGDRSEYVVSALRDLEAQARDEKAAMARLESQDRAPIELPGIDDIAQAAIDVLTRTRADTEAGREYLRRLFQNGRIQLVPTGDAYIARSKLRPIAILAESLPKKRQRDFFNEIALFVDCSGGTLRRFKYLLLLNFLAQKDA